MKGGCSVFYSQGGHSIAETWIHTDWPIAAFGPVTLPFQVNFLDLSAKPGHRVALSVILRA